MTKSQIVSNVGLNFDDLEVDICLIFVFWYLEFPRKHSR